MNRSIGVNINKDYKYILNKMKRYDTSRYHSKFSNKSIKDASNDFLFKIYDLKDEAKNINMNDLAQKFKDGISTISKKYDIKKSLSHNCNCFKKSCLALDKKVVISMGIGIALGAVAYASFKIIKS